MKCDHEYFIYYHCNYKCFTNCSIYFFYLYFLQAGSMISCEALLSNMNIL